ncbi:hypothetical protein [Halorussus halobius]|uniref:hypothetical protein n=1 Tax=Halorussus halobius TaxID=1710537 RepID=UPI0010927177|nr:hypothetical protein [Halorussus halobius]
MQAKSLLGSARVIDRRLEDLLAANLLSEGPAAWTHATAIRDALGDVAEQLRASVPLPAASDDPAPSDERFFGLLDAVAADPDPTPERVAEALADGSPADATAGDDEDGPLARLRADARVELRGSRLVVPLGDDPTGRNWWAVLEYLRESVAALASKASRVRSRMVVTSADGLLVTAWDSVTQRLDVLADVLEEMTANGRYAGRQATAADDESTEFVAWTADQFGSEG